jgi:uncharacterized protein with PhoU and TrkA domain
VSAGVMLRLTEDTATLNPLSVIVGVTVRLSEACCVLPLIVASAVKVGDAIKLTLATSTNCGEEITRVGAAIRDIELTAARTLLTVRTGSTVSARVAQVVSVGAAIERVGDAVRDILAGVVLRRLAVRLGEAIRLTDATSAR